MGIEITHEAMNRLVARTFRLRKAPVSGLTERERAVARLIAQGLLIKQVAAELGIAEATVDYHARQIRNYTGTTRTSEAVRILQEQGAL